MSGLIDNVMSHLGDAQVQQIAAQLGTDPASARAAIEHAVPLIVGGMAQNASTPQGAGALTNALGAHAGWTSAACLQRARRWRKFRHRRCDPRPHLRRQSSGRESGLGKLRVWASRMPDS